VKTLLIVSVACYAVGLLHAIFVFVRKQNSLFTVALFAVAAGFLLHTGSLAMRGLEVGRFPLVNYQEVCSFLGWTVAAYYLCVHFWYRSQALSPFIMPIIFVFAVTAWLVPVPTDPDVTSRFRGTSGLLLAVHGGFFVFSYAAFVITFLAGAMYIIQERELKRKRFGSIFHRLPSLDTCDDLSYKSLGLGFALLTLGILTGIVGSRRLNGIYWNGDPLEFLTLATWVVYFFVMHYRLTAGWRGRRAAWLGVAGFVIVLASLVGVGYFNGFHAFG
jgi:cytochrome c-type biogenesis protein CcsB